MAGSSNDRRLRERRRTSCARWDTPGFWASAGRSPGGLIDAGPGNRQNYAAVVPPRTEWDNCAGRTGEEFYSDVISSPIVTLREREKGRKRERKEREEKERSKCETFVMLLIITGLKKLIVINLTSKVPHLCVCGLIV